MNASDAAHHRYLATDRFGSLDGLRCLSIVPIIWHHSTSRPIEGFWGKGPFGVALFFCISGFLITTLLLRERRRTGTVSLGNFYARRGLRIFPLYYLVLLSYVVRAWFLPGTSPERAHFFTDLPFFASYTANWFVDFDVPHPVMFSFAWSLCVEEQFYALWPSFVRWIPGRPALFVCMLSLVLVDLAAEFGWLHGVLPPGSLALRIVTSFATPIGLGALMAILLDSPTGYRVLYRALGWGFSAPLALGLVILLLAMSGVPLYAFDLSLALLVVCSVITEHHALRPVLEQRLVRHIGVVSYGLYLLHITVIGSLRRLFPTLAESAPLLFGLSLPVSLGLATLSYFGFERRFLALRVRFRASGQSPA